MWPEEGRSTDYKTLCKYIKEAAVLGSTTGNMSAAEKSSCFFINGLLY